MHEIHHSLIEAQAQSIGVKLLVVNISEYDTTYYETQMKRVLNKAKAEGIETVIFGDIFLQDLREYRETNLAKIGMRAVFPLWGIDTSKLVLDFINLQYKSVVCCVNNAYLKKEDVGQMLTKAYIKNLPADVDCCGENGEYHSFCYDGPIFKKPIKIGINEIYFNPLDTRFQLPDKKNKITTGFWLAKIQLTTQTD